VEYETYTAQTVAEAVELANLAAGGAASEAELREVLRLYHLKPGPLDVDGFVVLGDRIREVFRAPDADARVAVLNRLIAFHEPAPTIADHDGQGPHFHFAPDDGDDLRRVGASLAMALAHVVVDHGAGRLGCCQAPGCPRVFVDHTRNSSQRFCSRTCATRVHVAEHRARSTT
jgi:predicted RNA-binding Zn ribbon-like protein